MTRLPNHHPEEAMGDNLHEHDGYPPHSHRDTPGHTVQGLSRDPSQVGVFTPQRSPKRKMSLTTDTMRVLVLEFEKDEAEEAAQIISTVLKAGGFSRATLTGVVPEQKLA